MTIQLEQYIGKTLTTDDGFEIDVERWYLIHCEDCGDVEKYANLSEAKAAAKQHRASH
jgi:predicted nucleic-acid-binding Zn-ribbon protein